MPSITLGRKRPSEAIVLDGTKQNKKVKFTDDGQAVVVKATPVSVSPTTHSSKVKPDYSKVTKRGDKKEQHSRRDTKEANGGSTSILNTEDIDFPRGGGSALTPLEHKEMRAEGLKEAEMEIFKEQNEASPTQPSRKRMRNGKSKLDAFPSSKKGKPGDKDALRIEYLTYKKILPGTRVLAQVVTMTALSVVVSLPHQMIGHIPIDKVSKGLNDAIDVLAGEDDDSSNSQASSNDRDTDEYEKMEGGQVKEEIPTLQDIFHPGQYVRAIVTAVHPHGVVAPPSASGTSLGKPRNELEKASRRVELSLFPEDVNKGVTAKDLGKGFTLPASVASIEDHGYILDFGIPNVSGFLSFKEAKQELPGKSSRKLKVGMLLDTYVKKMEENGRMCAVGVGEKVTSSELSNLTSTSAVNPGALVRGLITATSSSGINVQVLGLFNGTIHPLHISAEASKLQVGKKVQARILWDVLGMEPRQFALSTLEHVVSLQPRNLREAATFKVASGDGNEEPEGGYPNEVERAYPIGTILHNVKVSRVDSDRGLFLDVAQGLTAVVHISDVSDEHVPTLSATSGPYKVDSTHRARVTGFHRLDGILQCSMKESILEQKWLRVDDVRVGEMVKGTIMNLTDRGLFVSVSGNVHAVVWPNHYADIRLKHPERKFKVGKSIKCRVLVVDPEKNRICLTAKKTLMESTLSIISNVADVDVGAVAHATVFKVSERYLSVEFYNGVRGIIPMKEATDTSTHTLEGLFSIGQVVKVRITEVKPDGTLLVASILKASADFISPATEINKIQIGSAVSGTVTDIHKDNVVLKLIPTQVTALLSLNNLANFRTTSVSQLRTSLKTGVVLGDLVIVSKNSSKALVIVAVQPKQKAKLPAQDSSLRIDKLKVGQSYPGMVVKQNKKGATVRLAKHVFGTLHPTDVSDDYSTSNSFPAVDSVINVVVINVDVTSHQVVLSTRPSRVNESSDAKAGLTDPEILDIQSLKVGQTVRGFVKSVADSGLFVALSRALDARVQIKELFDEYVKDWKPRFKDNQLIQGRILNINTDTNQIEMTLRSGDLTRAAATKSLSAFTKGDRVDGVVKKVEEYGVFVEIKGTKVSGLCHKSELADKSGPSAAEILKSLQEGDPVRALVLSVDTEKKRISFGLKPSYFFEEDLQDESRENADEAEASDDEMVDDASQIDDEMQGPDDDDGSVNEEILVVPRRHTEAETTGTTSGAKASEIVPTLSLTAPLRWDTNAQATETAEIDSETSDDEVDEPARKKRKRKHEIQHDLTVNIQQQAPQSSTDFERLLLGSPNSSYLWLQFMAFQLQLSEIEMAREVGRRALKAINFREEQERLNVWIALLNLETSYGTEASLDVVFKEAARANDSKTIHWRLALLLDDSQKPEQAEEQFRKTCKKFGGSSKVWTLFAEHYFKRSMSDEARQLLPRSLLSLDKRKHLKTISKFAQLEYRMGDPERGRTIFEGIIDTHSKRLDLWNIYIDMEAGQNEIQRIRSICERAITLKLSKKKAKFLFKKWLELERRLGDEQGADFVKQKAVEWTQNATQE